LIPVGLFIPTSAR